MIGYPYNKIKSNKKDINYKNRGIDFENEIYNSNKFYIENKIAYIYKKPTPVKVVKVVNNDGNHKITEAYYSEKSTTDYNGIYKGKYVDFEAKECATDKFNISSNLKEHQFNHLVSIYQNGGIALLLIKFSKRDEVYFLEIEKVIDYLENKKSKMLTYAFIRENGYKVEQDYNPPLQYVRVLEKIVSKELHE